MLYQLSYAHRVIISDFKFRIAELTHIVYFRPWFVNKHSTFRIPQLDSTGAPEGIRTPDPQLRRLLLYPPELQAHSISDFELRISD